MGGSERERVDALVVVDLTVSIDVRLANHLLDLVVRELLAYWSMAKSKLTREEKGGRGKGVRVGGEAREEEARRRWRE